MEPKILRSQPQQQPLVVPWVSDTTARLVARKQVYVAVVACVLTLRTRSPDPVIRCVK